MSGISNDVANCSCSVCRKFEESRIETFADALAARTAAAWRMEQADKAAPIATDEEVKP